MNKRFTTAQRRSRPVEGTPAYHDSYLLEREFDRDRDYDAVMLRSRSARRDEEAGDDA